MSPDPCRGDIKTKLMANSTAEGALTDIFVSNQALYTVYKFKYLGAIVSNEGSRLKVIARIAQVT